MPTNVMFKLILWDLKFDKIKNWINLPGSPHSLILRLSLTDHVIFTPHFFDSSNTLSTGRCLLKKAEPVSCVYISGELSAPILVYAAARVGCQVEIRVTGLYDLEIRTVNMKGRDFFCCHIYVD